MRFRLTPPTEFASHCHCNSCRKAHGAAFVTWTSVPSQRFHWESGQELLTDYASSDAVTWRFCSRCGSSLLYRSTATPERVYVTVANLESLDRAVEGHVSYEEKAPWLQFDDSLPCFRAKSDERVR